MRRLAAAGRWRADIAPRGARPVCPGSQLAGPTSERRRAIRNLDRRSFAGGAAVRRGLNHLHVDHRRRVVAAGIHPSRACRADREERPDGCHLRRHWNGHAGPGRMSTCRRPRWQSRVRHTRLRFAQQWYHGRDRRRVGSEHAPGGRGDLRDADTNPLDNGVAQRPLGGFLHQHPVGWRVWPEPAGGRERRWPG